MAVLAGSLATEAMPSSAATPLFKDDLAGNRRVAIDAPTSSLDAQLDQILGSQSGFSTQPLRAIDDKIRAELASVRLRATARLILFLYPGAVTAERLKTLPEIGIDVDVDIDPCDRTLCKEAIGRHIEVIGRAVGRATISGPGYTLRFHSLMVHASSDLRGQEAIVYSVPIAQAIAAGARTGGGLAFIESRVRAAEEFEPRMVRAIIDEANRARVLMAKPPRVSRQDPRDGQVQLTLKGDRARMHEQVLAGMLAAARALVKSPATPADTTVEVVIEIPFRTLERHRYRAPYSALADGVAGRLSGSALWASYIAEARKDAQEFNFADE